MKKQLEIKQILISELKAADYNPRKWDDQAVQNLTESIQRFGLVDPIIVNSAPDRRNIVIGGHFRLAIAKQLGYKEVPAVYINIPDVEKEKELNLRLNKNTGEWDWDLLAEFDESFLSDVGFNSQDLDEIFDIEDSPEEFDLEKELQKLDIHKINIQKGNIYALGGSKLMCGDSTIEEDVLRLMGNEKANMCFTDPPYILDYLHGKKKKGSAVTGFGAKRDRRYLETDVLPPDFTEKWMANIAKVQKEHFSIIIYENWKNIRTIWGEMEKYWKVKNMIVWHLPNRHQGFASKYKFFSKHDIAMVGTSTDTDIEFNNEGELDGLQEEYETALYAISGKPHWEGYEKGKKTQPTDFIEFNASDEKHSGQGVVFGTKPTEILIPYIKVLTKRGDLIITEMFKRVGLGRQSGRDIKLWFDEIGFTTRTGVEVYLSSIYLMLKNPFYYGEFEYPIRSGNWYKGSHSPLTTKEIFDKVQKQLIIPFPKAKWGSKTFTFKDLLICGSCGTSFTAQDRYRKRKFRDPRYHIYYNCTKTRDPNCQEPYVTEEKLIKELIKYVNFTSMAHPQMIQHTEKLKFSMEQYKKIRDEILLQQDIDPDKTLFDIREYAKHTLHHGIVPEKREIIKALGGMIYIHNELVCSAPSKIIYPKRLNPNSTLEN